MPDFTLDIDFPPGINPDDTRFSAMGQWVDGDNVRFLNGKPQTVGGVSANHFTFTDTAQPCRDMFVITRSGSAVVAYGQAGFGGAGHLYIGTATTEGSEETPASLGNRANIGWSFAAFGTVLLTAGRGEFSTPGGRLYEQSGTSTATHVTQAPDRNVRILVTNERQVLSFGCNEESGGTFNAMCIRGSDLEDYTDWTTTATNNAFEHILDGGGEIIDAALIGQYVGVWASSGIWLGQFIGDPAQTYRFDKVVQGHCPLSPRSVQVANGVAYWFDNALNFWAWSPGSMPVQIHCPMTADINIVFESVSIWEHTSFLSYNPRFDELWFFYANPPDSPAAYIAYSISESAQQGRPIWFKGALSRTCILFDDRLTVTGIAANSSQQVFTVEARGTCIASAYIQSADVYLEKGRRRAMVKSLKPDFELLSANAIAINFTIFTKQYPQGSATTLGPYAITSATTKKDFRASGMMASFKIASTDTDGWRLGKPTLDCVTLGER